MKKQLGQFFTTNCDYILQGFEEFVKNKEVTDPFAGNRDLMFWSVRNNCKKAVGFDCDEKYVNGKNVFYHDAINDSQKYKFICTNPPYLHKNKADQKIKNRFFSGIHGYFEDLYQVSIFSILNCEEGILILPLNFLSAENSQKIRTLFFDKFEIVKLNIFSEQVFEDTTYNVIAFYFRKKKDSSGKNKISATLFPQKRAVDFIVERKYDWQLGGEFIHRVKNTKNHLGIFRLTEDYLRSGEYQAEIAFQNIRDKKNLRISEETKKTVDKNILFLRAIDSKNGRKIQLEDIRKYGVVGLVGKNTSRTMAHLIFQKGIPIREQRELMRRFNERLNQERERYLSFFLTNFRDNNRKRISFDWAYKFLNHLYNEKNQRQSVLF